MNFPAEKRTTDVVCRGAAFFEILTLSPLCLCRENEFRSRSGLFRIIFFHGKLLCVFASLRLCVAFRGTPNVARHNVHRIVKKIAELTDATETTPHYQQLPLRPSETQLRLTETQLRLTETQLRLTETQLRLTETQL